MTRSSTATLSSAGSSRAALMAPAATVGLLIVAVTLLAAIASAAFPELGPTRAPRPTLHGTPREALSILATNMRTLVVPLLLVAGRWHTAGATRHAGDLLVGALVIANATIVGLAVGRYPIELAAYLPHLPLEDAALALAAGAWLARRTDSDAPISLRRATLLTVAAAAAAALVETYAVPDGSAS